MDITILLFHKARACTHIVMLVLARSWLQPCSMTMDPVYDDCLMFVLVSNSDVMDNTHGAPVYRWFEVCEEILPMVLVMPRNH